MLAIKFLASNSLHNHWGQKWLCPCHNAKNFEQTHWNQLFFGMYGLAVILSISSLDSQLKYWWDTKYVCSNDSNIESRSVLQTSANQIRHHFNVSEKRQKKNNIANIAWQMRRRVPNFFLVIALYLIDLRLVRGLVNDKFEAIEK